MSIFPSILSLHRYFIWTDKMKIHFENALTSDEFKEIYKSNNQLEKGLRVMISDAGTYMSYWYSSLYVVIEGWKELNLSDPEIDELLDSPNIDLLRRFRNGTFHYQEDYISSKFFDFFGEKGVVDWVRSLHKKLGDFILEEVRKQVP